MAIKVNGTTVIDDSRNLINIASGAGASTTAGAVSTYAFLVGYISSPTGFNISIAGSNLSYANDNGMWGGTPSGTWSSRGGMEFARSTLFQRIS